MALGGQYRRLYVWTGPRAEYRSSITIQECTMTMARCVMHTGATCVRRRETLTGLNLDKLAGKS